MRAGETAEVCVDLILISGSSTQFQFPGFISRKGKLVVQPSVKIPNCCIYK